MNEPLYKTFLTARLSLRSNNKIARQYFFLLLILVSQAFRGRAKENVIKNYMELKDTRI